MTRGELLFLIDVLRDEWDWRAELSFGYRSHTTCGYCSLSNRHSDSCAYGKAILLLARLDATEKEAQQK